MMAHMFQQPQRTGNQRYRAQRRRRRAAMVHGELTRASSAGLAMVNPAEIMLSRLAASCTRASSNAPTR